ncbi:LysR family transcriptional regulator [Lacisediminimonas profundi]|uniref:LysR family transcriptional regulator n=1 Tax=Lacisediminimonas profundi TaxID=2603856 RepID=UPI00124B9193|nr:LysR family transcriptional regulator [Lacisediminimonas profundi]
MRNATLRQLKVFETVARHSSFSRAAEELHLTQPAISTQVKTLEGHVGMPLFEQLGKKIYLTPAGTELLHHSRAIIAHFQAAEEAMTQFKGVTGGRLNVAVISAGDYFLPRLLVNFAGRHQGVILNLSVHNREELLRQLADNMTDLAIMVRPPTDMDTVNESFAPHPYVVVAAPGHPLAREKNIPIAALTDAPWIIREKGSDTRKSMEEGLAQHLPGMNIAMEIKSTETIKQAVMAGMGISFLSAHTIGLELQAKSLVVLDVQELPVMHNWYLVHRRNKRLPPVAQAFREFLLAEGAPLLEQLTRLDPRLLQPPRTKPRSRNTRTAGQES